MNWPQVQPHITDHLYFQVETPTRGPEVRDAWSLIPALKQSFHPPVIWGSHKMTDLCQVRLDLASPVGVEREPETLITLPSLGNPSGILGKRVKEGISFLPHRLSCHPALNRPGGEARLTQGKQASTNYRARIVCQPLVCTGRQCVGGCCLKQGLVFVPAR